MKKFIINDCAYLEHELVAKATQAIEQAADWERSHWEVILNWLENPSYIEATTSGTTGVPKVHKHSGRAVRASAMITSEYFDLREGSLAFLCLPSTFIAGKMMLLRALIHGWQLDWVEPSSMPFHRVKKHYDFTAITPHQCQEALQAGYDFKLFKHILLGGSAVLPHTREQLLKCSSQFYLGYAMTETLTHIAMQVINGSNDSQSFTCLGRTTVSVDAQQCLVIHAPHLDHPTVHTSDVAEIIDNKHFKIIGRFDHRINSGGIKIFPEVLEAKVSKHMQRPFYFKGVEDDVLGERLVLMIEDESWSDEEVNALQKTLASELGPFERPKEIQFKKPFERTANQKIIKR